MEMKTETGTKDNPKIVEVPCEDYPESCQHMKDCWKVPPKPPQKKPIPDTFPIAESGLADKNRQAALDSIPTQGELNAKLGTGNSSEKWAFDRDEFPLAMFDYKKVSGYGKDWVESVKAIRPSDNRASGKFIGNQLKGLTPGTMVKIEIICQKGGGSHSGKGCSDNCQSHSTYKNSNTCILPPKEVEIANAKKIAQLLSN